MRGGWTDADTLEVGERSISCPLCGHDRFRQRSILLNTAGMTFLGVEWANRGATACRCDNCSHILLFADD